MTVNLKQLQHVISYAAIVMAVLTQTISGIQLDPTASAILGAFGILLHPSTSITSTESSSPKSLP